MNRVDQLGDRDFGFTPKRAIPYKSVIPLQEVIAETYGTGVGKKVLAMYEQMVAKKSEFEILLDLPKEEIEKLGNSMIAESVIRIRERKVKVEVGYDGIFGKVHIYSDKERDKLFKKVEQSSLF